MKRTLDDIDRLTSPDANIRLCKGAYKENKEIAYQGYQKIFCLGDGFQVQTDCYKARCSANHHGFFEIPEDVDQYEVLIGERSTEYYNTVDIEEAEIFQLM